MAHETVDLTGDWSNTTEVEVFAPLAVSRVRFNGKDINASRTSYGSLVGQLDAGTQSTASIQAQLPPLNNWKVNDGLLERSADYDDSRWVGMLTLFCMDGSVSDNLSCESYKHF